MVCATNRQTGQVRNLEESEYQQLVHFGLLIHAGSAVKCQKQCVIQHYDLMIHWIIKCTRLVCSPSFVCIRLLAFFFIRLLLNPLYAPESLIHRSNGMTMRFKTQTLKIRAVFTDCQKKGAKFKISLPATASRTNLDYCLHLASCGCGYYRETRPVHTSQHESHIFCFVEQ